MTALLKSINVLPLNLIFAKSKIQCIANITQLKVIFIYVRNAYICVHLIYRDGTLNKTIPLAPNPLDANHDHGKPETESSHQPSSTVEVLYMTSDIGNKKPSHLYSPLESAPQKVRYYDNSDGIHNIYVCCT